MIEQPLDLRFKGDRDYLHGTDMYEALQRAARAAGLPVGVHRLSIHGFARTQCRLALGAPGEALAIPENRVAEFSLETSAGRALGYMAETGDRVEGRYPFDEDAIGARACGEARRIVVDGTPPCAPIEVVVALTKKLHNTVLPRAQGKWVFTRIELPRALVPQDAGRIAIELKHNFNDRLTKSGVTSGNEAIGHIYFSLWRP